MSDRSEWRTERLWIFLSATYYHTIPTTNNALIKPLWRKCSQNNAVGDVICFLVKEWPCLSDSLSILMASFSSAFCRRSIGRLLRGRTSTPCNQVSIRRLLFSDYHFHACIIMSTAVTVTPLRRSVALQTRSRRTTIGLRPVPNARLT